MEPFIEISAIDLLLSLCRGIAIPELARHEQFIENLPHLQQRTDVMAAYAGAKSVYAQYLDIFNFSYGNAEINFIDPFENMTDVTLCPHTYIVPIIFKLFFRMKA